VARGPPPGFPGPFRDSSPRRLSGPAKTRALDPASTGLLSAPRLSAFQELVSNILHSGADHVHCVRGRDSTRWGETGLTAGAKAALPGAGGQGSPRASPGRSRISQSAAMTRMAERETVPSSRSRTGQASDFRPWRLSNARPAALARPLATAAKNFRSNRRREDFIAGRLKKDAPLSTRDVLGGPKLQKQ
jgi:hypothetical protein